MSTLIAYQKGNCAEICKTYQKQPFFVFLSKLSKKHYFLFVYTALLQDTMVVPPL